jgi:hypothetical protein
MALMLMLMLMLMLRMKEQPTLKDTLERESSERPVMTIWQGSQDKDDDDDEDEGTTSTEIYSGERNQ